MTRSNVTSAPIDLSRAGTQLADAADEAHRRAAPWVERVARLGYAAKGVLYLLIGGLALQAAIGWGGQVGDSRSALSTLEGHGWLGTALLWVVGLGLAGYALWCLFRAALDPEGVGSDAKGIAKRVFYSISGIVHAMLATWVFTHLTGNGGGGSGDDGARDRVGMLLEWGLAGRLAVAAAGIAIAGYGVQQLIKAWKEDLDKQLSLSRMGEGTRKTTRYTARLGMAARGVIFMIVGWFLLQAAWYAAQGEAGGLGDALRAVGGFGAVLLGVVAAGLAAYGLYMLIVARYRRIDAH